MNKTAIESAIKTALAMYGYKEIVIVRSKVCDENTDVLGIELKYGSAPDKLYFSLDLTFEGYSLIWVETNEMGVPMSHLDAIKKAIKQARKELRK